MRQILLASRNVGKLAELVPLLSDLSIQVVSPDQVGIEGEFDVEETGDTFEENATLKARGFGLKSGLATLSDDTGLCVDALSDQPGVYSKRYGSSDLERNQKLIQELTGVPSEKRTARFICAMCLYDPDTDTTTCVEGSIAGRISEAIIGDQGFGYDPVFIPDEGNGQSFAQLGREFKNKVSHRARAIEKMKLVLGSG